MRAIGCAALVAGVLLILYALNRETTIGDVVNIDALHRQMLLFNGGCALSVIGAVIVTRHAPATDTGDVHQGSDDRAGMSNSQAILLFLGIVRMVGGMFAFASLLR